MDDLIHAVRLRLTLDELELCEAGDANADGLVTVEDLHVALAAALLGCAG